MTAPAFDTDPGAFERIPMGGIIEEHRTSWDGKPEVRRMWRVPSSPTVLGETRFMFAYSHGSYWCIDTPWDTKHADGVRIVPPSEWSAYERVRQHFMTWQPDELSTSPWEGAFMAAVGEAHADRIWNEYSDWPDVEGAFLQLVATIEANGGLPRCGGCARIIVDGFCGCYGHRRPTLKGQDL